MYVSFKIPEVFYINCFPKNKRNWQMLMKELSSDVKIRQSGKKNPLSFEHSHNELINAALQTAPKPNTPLRLGTGIMLTICVSC